MRMREHFYWICYRKTVQVVLTIAMCLLIARSHSVWGQSAPTFTELDYSRGSVSPNFSPQWVAVADFNGDGIPDVAAVSCSGAGSADLAIYLGRGDGSLQLPLTFSIAQQANVVCLQAVLAGDLNGDGKIDLVLTGQDENFLGKLIFLSGNGDGTFQAPVESSLGSSPLEDLSNLATADFNGDGKLDIVVSTNLYSYSGTGAAEILFAAGNGNGTFAVPMVLPESDGGGSIAAADLNHDGKPDIAWVGSELNVALGDGNGGFSAATQYPLSNLSPVASFLAIADFNGDGVPDILTDTMVLHPVQQTSINVFPGNGDGTFGTAVNTILETGTFETSGPIAIADFEANGHLDLFVGGVNQAPNLYLHGNGDGSFTVSTLNLDFGTFSPEAWSSVAANLTGNGKPDIVFVDPNATVGVLLNAPGDAPIALYPAGYSFGDQTLGAAGTTGTFTIGNTGASPFTINSPALDNTTDFSMTTNCGGPIPAQGSCTATVAFQPQSTGTKTANLSISGSNLSAASVIRITGQAIAPAVSRSPATLAFGYQKVGTTSTSQTLQVTNSGTGPLNLLVSIQGDFQQTNNCPATLAQGASCTVTVMYAPEVPGSETGRVIFNTNAVPSQSAVPLTGIGYIIGPVLAISPSSLNFGSQYVGTSSAPGVVTVLNNGDAPFSISSVTSTTGFVPLSTCGSTVQPSFSCAIGIFFDPATTGSQSGTLSVATNLATATPPIALTGTGTSISVGPSASSSTSATITAGQSATYSMSITPQSGYTGTVSLSCAGLPRGITCSVSQNSVTLNGLAAVTATVTVNSTASAAASRRQVASRDSGLLVLATPLVIFFLRRGKRFQWMRPLLAFGALLVAAGLAVSCGGSSSGQQTTTTEQTYTFFLESQPATGITIDTPLTLTVQTTQQ